MCLLFARARAAKEGWSFAQLATAAYMDRVDLSAHGFYATPEITGMWAGDGSDLIVDAGC